MTCLRLALLILLLCWTANAQNLDMDLFKGMNARSVGPAGMSGRVTSIDVVLANPNIIYAGTASGGLWRSTSGGIAWSPLFDDQPCASIGVVKVDQNNPDVIWVGTGEGNPRNSQTSGCGVFKSIDGGSSWLSLGLEGTRNIHRLILHPDDPNIAWVGAQGSAWNEHPERGVFKTSDGGSSWKNVLFSNSSSGVADLVAVPGNPNKLFCAMWEFRRWPWFFKSGGEGSGLHLSYDGGESWKKISSDEGLPKGELGRMGIAISANRPSRIYALIESKKNALYRSDDGGLKWLKVSDKNIGNRPFYYAEIHADPNDENRLFNLYSYVDVSEDGGKNFKTLLPFERVHPDHHAFWIDPEDSNFLIDGNDGGLALSRDGGANWSFITNLPLAQFYHISVDNEVPYNIYGGMQDNGSWRGPSRVWRYGDIRNSYWQEVSFGDGFDVVPDPENGRYGYSMSQGGFLYRYDRVTGNNKLIRPYHPDDVELRFNWNAALALDPFESGTLYYGSQFLHKSSDRGNSWLTISEDLSSNDPAKQKQLESGGLTFDTTQAENFTSIVAISPSPVKQGMLWVGTDDGNLWLTTDGGLTWKNMIKGLKGVPKGSWIPQIHASHHNQGEAFVLFDDHRRGNWSPYVYHTTNFGKSWQRLVGKGDVVGYALALVQDPRQPKLLFLGTEFGLYVSLDYGKSWSKWTAGYPTVSTMDLAVQSRSGDLVVGTFGRAAYVLDDLGPLRALATDGLELLSLPIKLFPIPDAYMVAYKQADGTRFTGESVFKGSNRKRGAMISFVYNPDPAMHQAENDEKDEKDESDESDEQEIKSDKKKVTVEILDSKGLVVRTLKHEVEQGINRMFWDFSRKGVPRFGSSKAKVDDPEPRGLAVAPGTYSVRITNGEAKTEATVRVLMDPRLEFSTAELDAREALTVRMQELSAEVQADMLRLTNAKASLKIIKDRLSERQDEVAKSLKKEGKRLKKAIKELSELVIQKKVQGILRDPSKVGVRLRSAMSPLRGKHSITTNDQIAIKRAEQAVASFKLESKSFFEEDWPAFKQRVAESKLSFFDD